MQIARRDQPPRRPKGPCGCADASARMAHHRQTQSPEEGHHHPAAIARSTEPGGKYLAVLARQLALQPRVRRLQCHRRCCMRRLGSSHRRHINRNAKMGPYRSMLNAVGINPMSHLGHFTTGSGSTRIIEAAKGLAGVERRAGHIGSGHVIARLIGIEIGESFPAHQVPPVARGDRPDTRPSLVTEAPPWADMAAANLQRDQALFQGGPRAPSADSSDMSTHRQTRFEPTWFSRSDFQRWNPVEQDASYRHPFRLTARNPTAPSSRGFPRRRDLIQPSRREALGSNTNGRQNPSPICASEGHDLPWLVDELFQAAAQRDDAS